MIEEQTKGVHILRHKYLFITKEWRMNLAYVYSYTTLFLNFLENQDNMAPIAYAKISAVLIAYKL